MHEEYQHDDITTLTVPQVVLLTLLTTIVASVATAIITVQLMAGVPGQTVFQTIEKVTETIVERPANTEPSREVVKEGDLVAEAIDANNNSSLEIFYGNEMQEIVMLGYGFVVGDNTLITRVYEDPERMTSAGTHRISTHGSDRIMLWRIIDEGERFENAPEVEFKKGAPQAGQTMVYIGGDGSIVRGTITEVDTSTLGFSEDLTALDIGLLVDTDARVIAVWTGDEIVRSRAVVTQIDQLAVNDLLEIPSGDFDSSQPVETNPDNLTAQEKQNGCELMGGVFNEYGECLGIERGQCLSLGGEHNDCASACRHDEEAQVCAQECVVVCKL